MGVGTDCVRGVGTIQIRKKGMPDALAGSKTLRQCGIISGDQLEVLIASPPPSPAKGGGGGGGGGPNKEAKELKDTQQRLSEAARQAENDKPDDARRKAAEDDARRRAEDIGAQIRKAAEEEAAAIRKAAEDDARQIAAQRAADNEAARPAKEDDSLRLAAEEEAAQIRRAAEEDAVRIRKAAEDEAAKRRASQTLHHDMLVGETAADLGKIEIPLRITLRGDGGNEVRVIVVSPDDTVAEVTEKMQPGVKCRLRKAGTMEALPPAETLKACRIDQGTQLELLVPGMAQGYEDGTASGEAMQFEVPDDTLVAGEC